MIAAVLVSMMLSSSAADAPTAPTTDPAQAAARTDTVAAPKVDDRDRVVCRREEVTGSHRPEKICHTKREWEQMTEDSHRMLKEGGIQAVSGAQPTTFGGPH
jgi:hypothetical protein